MPRAMPDALIAEFTGPQTLRYEALPMWLVALRLLGATGLAALIGYEREARDHAAGLRTNMLIGLAAATYAVIGTTLVVGGGSRPEERVQTDPLRLVEAVTSGVAFLAAGLIVFAGGRVRGLSTGASMWLSAAAGMAVGLGLWAIGTLAAIGGMAILTLMRGLERRLGIRGKRHYDEPHDDG